MSDTIVRTRTRRTPIRSILDNIQRSSLDTALDELGPGKDPAEYQLRALKAFHTELGEVISTLEGGA